MNGRRLNRRLPARLVRAWCGLTREEQQALVAVLALLVLGSAARWWRQTAHMHPPPPVGMAERTVR